LTILAKSILPEWRIEIAYLILWRGSPVSFRETIYHRVQTLIGAFRMPYSVNIVKILKGLPEGGAVFRGERGSHVNDVLVGRHEGQTVVSSRGGLNVVEHNIQKHVLRCQVIF